MYKIGEFSKIAQVSIRLLRYYDEIGLFKPDEIDPATGYRYYRAQQLEALNRILALRDLGLSLDQIVLLIHDDVSPEAIRGMLMLKKAQLQQTVAEEMARLRNVEFRLNQLEHNDWETAIDIVVKAVPAQPFLALRHVCPSYDVLLNLFQAMRQLYEHTNLRRMALHVCVNHSTAMEPDAIDIEMGFAFETPATSAALSVPGFGLLEWHELPEATLMGTAVHLGDSSEHLVYNALGIWIEANGYRIAGPEREVFHEIGLPDHPEKNVIEIQIPVMHK